MYVCFMDICVLYVCIYYIPRKHTVGVVGTVVAEAKEVETVVAVESGFGEWIFWGTWEPWDRSSHASAAYSWKRGNSPPPIRASGRIKSTSSFSDIVSNASSISVRVVSE
jgi:hypothetical protein